MLRDLLSVVGRLLVVSACLLWLAAGSLEASPINPFNARPVPVFPAPGSEQGLQSIVDTILGAGLNVNTDQSTAGMWGLATFPPTTIPTLVFEYTANAASQRFGIWFGSDSSNLYTADIFLGPATGSNNGGFTSAGVEFMGNTLNIFASAPNCVANVNCGSFMDPLVNSSAFGFYWSLGNTMYYTVDALNPGGTARGLAFNKTTNWAIAFEDGTDFDYNDIVVKVESIAPVPEPGTLLLIGSGLLALGLRRRNRRG